MLLAVSAYGLIVIIATANQNYWRSWDRLVIDPILFLISTLFILGVGLVLLRIYPFLVRLLFGAGKKRWSPILYASFIQVGRAGGQDRSLMLFIILSLSVGIFNANSARTLNNNMEEKIKYSNGADLNIMAYWESNESTLSTGAGYPPEMEGTESFVGVFSEPPVQYKEPPFMPFTELKGIEMATKVFRQNDITIQTSNREGVKGRKELLAIIPDEFGKTAWFREGLLKTHWYHYLNLLSKGDPRAALVTEDLQENYGVEKGDSIWISWGNQGYLELVVYEFIDYWPSYNPNRKEGDTKSSNLIVAQFDYIQSNTALEPYEVWLKKLPGATSQEVYQDIEDKEIEIESITDTSQEIIKAKNDPMLQGTNGALTLGFVVTMSISTIGFLIYWILSIRQRVIQFGIFRAMGLSVKNIIGLLVCEQILISGTSILICIVIGGLTSDLFVPLLQMVSSAGNRYCPLRLCLPGRTI